MTFPSKRAGKTMRYIWAILLAFPSTLLSGCVNYSDSGCSTKSDTTLDYAYCCCEVVDTIMSGYGGGDCSSLDDCHDAGFYYPDLTDGAVNAPDYTKGDGAWTACYSWDTEAIADYGECDGGDVAGVEVCAEDLQGVWATAEMSVEADMTADGTTCRSADLRLFLSFPGTGDAGDAIGIFGGTGTVTDSTTPAYENALNPGGGYVFATATIDALGHGIIEILDMPPRCGDSALLAIASYALSDADGDGTYDTMTADFTRDPAQEGMEAAGCNGFPLHDVTLTLLDSSDADVATILDVTRDYWNTGGGTCGEEVSAYAECAEPPAGDTPPMPPPPANGEEFVSRIPPRNFDFPINGNYPAPSYGIAASMWLATQAGPPESWIGRARTVYDPLFRMSGTALPILGMLGGGIHDTPVGLIRDEGAHRLEQLQADFLRRSAISVLAKRWMSDNHGGMSAGDFEWYVWQVILSLPNPIAPAVGSQPPPPPIPPIN